MRTIIFTPSEASFHSVQKGMEQVIVSLYLGVASLTILDFSLSFRLVWLRGRKFGSRKIKKLKTKTNTNKKKKIEWDILKR